MYNKSEKKLIVIIEREKMESFDEPELCICQECGKTFYTHAYSGFLIPEICSECSTKPPKFQKTYCSQCGAEFGPGDHGYSHCEDHKKC